VSAWLDRARRELSTQGWSAVLPSPLGHATVQGAFAPALVADPRGAGKKHARDVVAYDWTPEGSGQLAWPLLRECESAAHGSVDDFSRFHLLDCGPADVAARTVLTMIPPELRRASGRMSADYFHYGRGSGCEAHQDKFGDFVIIWVLDRDGEGGESFLAGLDGREVFRRALRPGEMLLFRDDMFYHGVEPMRGTVAFRDALIFITLKD